MVWLDVSGRGLRVLDPIPDNVTELGCGNNQLTILPDLPARLTRLWCWRNQLRALPDLPVTLTELKCWRNQLTVLPDLPAGLDQLNCTDNQLTVLPELPARLTQLWCFNNKLTTLPELPAGLTELRCYDNQLTMLPDLPAGLTKLDCRNNPFPPALQAILDRYEFDEGQLSYKEEHMPDLIRDVNAYNAEQRARVPVPPAPRAAARAAARDAARAVQAPALAPRVQTPRAPPSRFLYIPRGKQNTIMYNDIKDGNNMVTWSQNVFLEEPRYYKKSTYNSLPDPKLDPQTRAPIQNPMFYKARLVGGKKSRRTRRLRRKVRKTQRRR